MSFGVISALATYMLVSSFTPGPGNILTLTSMTNYGWKKGKQVVFGICASYFCVQFICSLVIFSLSEWFNPALKVIKYVGFAYLIYLAIHIVKSKPVDINESKKPTFLSGFLLQLVFSKEINPQFNWGNESALVKINMPSLMQGKLKKRKPPSIM